MRVGANRGCRRRSARGSRRRRGRRRGAGAARRRRAASARSGRRTVKRLPDRGPSLCAATRAAVQLDDAPDQREADAESAARALERRVDLREHLEDLVGCSGGEADAAVDDRDLDARAVALDVELDRRRRLGEYFAALLSRFENTCESRVVIGVERRSRRPARARRARGRSASSSGIDASRSRRRAPRAASSARAARSSLPRLMRATSSRSSISRTSRRSWRCIASCSGCGAPRRAAARSSALPSGASGLRSSCASVARNSSLRRLTSSSRSFGADALGDLRLQLDVARRELRRWRRAAIRSALRARAPSRRAAPRWPPRGCWLASCSSRRLRYSSISTDDLAAQDLRHDRHRHVVDRAELVAAHAIELGDVAPR